MTCSAHLYELDCELGCVQSLERQSPQYLLTQVVFPSSPTANRTWTWQHLLQQFGLGPGSMKTYGSIKSIPVLLDICTDGDLAMLLGGCNVPRWAMHVATCQYAMHAACQIKKRRCAQLFILFTVFTLPRIVQTFYVFV